MDERAGRDAGDDVPTDVSPLVGVTCETLYARRRRLEVHDPAGSVGLRQPAQKSRLREAVERAGGG